MSMRRRRAALVLVVIVSNFTLTACHELYCNFVEGLTGVPVDCSHEGFPDLGDIPLPSLPEPPTLPTTTTTVPPDTSTTSTSISTSTSSSTSTSTSTSTSLPSSSSSSTTMLGLVPAFTVADLRDDADPPPVPTRTIPERPVRPSR